MPTANAEKSGAQSLCDSWGWGVVLWSQLRTDIKYGVNLHSTRQRVNERQATSYALPSPNRRTFPREIKYCNFLQKYLKSRIIILEMPKLALI